MPKVPILCPRCKTPGAEPRGPLVIPYTNGQQEKIGRLFGCVHCGLGFFECAGEVKPFGYLRAQPAPAAGFVPPAQGEEPLKVAARDADMPWR